MKIFAIETSCDETALSLVECSGGANRPRFKVLQNIVHTQIAVHRPFGGVVPMLAKREHIKNLPKLLKKMNVTGKDFDAIAVTVGPGLEPALWQGVEFSKMLSEKFKKPLLGANHMEGHLYSILLPKKAVEIKNDKLKIKKFGEKHPEIKFPAVGLVVSGGHTIVVVLKSMTKWVKLGETRDDAAGEAFDKVAKMLKLPYPGGPEIQKLSAKGNPRAINFPRPMVSTPDYDFSFSGLKTAVLYYLRDYPVPSAKRHKLYADIAASFQQAVIDVLVKKAVRAAREYGAKTMFLCGGVAANVPLRNAVKTAAEKEKCNFVVPEFVFNTDNAVMIAVAAYMRKVAKRAGYKISAQPNLNL